MLIRILDPMRSASHDTIAVDFDRAAEWMELAYDGVTGASGLSGPATVYGMDQNAYRIIAKSKVLPE